MDGIETLDPGLRPYAAALLDVANSYGLRPTITSAFRSVERQRDLYTKWRSGASTIPAAPPGRSLHNYGHAFDLVVADPDGQQWLGLVWEHWGGRWGGRFDDPIHFDTGAVIR